MTPRKTAGAFQPSLTQISCPPFFSLAVTREAAALRDPGTCGGEGGDGGKIPQELEAI